MTTMTRQRTTAVTIKQVAEAAGVSKTTAVCVLNDTPNFNVPETTRLRVREAAGRLGYRRNALAAALKRGYTQTVGVVLPLPLSDDTPHHEQVYGKDVLVAAAAAAAKVDLRLTMIALDPEQPVSVQEVTDQRVDGLILVSIRDDEFARSAYATAFPCVSVGSGYAERPILLDNYQGGVLASEHLIRLGHRRIVHWAGSGTGQAPVMRRKGFEDSARAAGLSAEQTQVVGSVESLRALLSLPGGTRPTAVFAFNDWYAFQVLAVARELGLSVPRDLSVVGFDNNILSRMALPSVTTVHNPLAEQMDAAIAVLAGLWRGDAEVMLPPPILPRLVVRDSTCPPATRDRSLRLARSKSDASTR
jgi:LacI family transcriptional regulator